jgi:hypothetical protein
MMAEEPPRRESLRREALDLADQIRQTNGSHLDNSGPDRRGGGDGGDTDSGNRRVSLDDRNGSRGNDDTNDNASKKSSNKRSKVTKSRSLKKKMKTSEILDKEDWPIGYTPERVDALTPADAISIRNLQSRREKEEKEFMPGRGSSTKDHVIKLVKFTAPNEDDCRKILHPARWQRQSLEHPKTYWDQYPIRRKEIVRNINLSIFGCEQQVSNATIAACHDRGRKGIKMCHFLPRNHNIEVCKEPKCWDIYENNFHYI